jgi:hypothetical protein
MTKPHFPNFFENNLRLFVCLFVSLSVYFLVSCDVCGEATFVIRHVIDEDLEYEEIEILLFLIRPYLPNLSFDVIILYI